MVTWGKVVDSLHYSKLTPQEEEVLLYGEYALIGWLIGKNRKEEAKRYTDMFEMKINKGLKKNPNSATLLAFYAVYSGFRIGITPTTVFTMANNNFTYVNKALQHRKGEPLPLVEQANSLYYRPFLLGGDKKKALELYQEAFDIYEKSGKCNWMYLNLGVRIAQIHTQYGQWQKAENLYLKLLKIEPGFQWVRDELLPDLRSGRPKNVLGDTFE